MVDDLAATPGDSIEPCRIAFRFAIDGDLRFVSHHDTLRIFKRALVRANLPVKYSEGFNPQPRLMLPLPRPVGVASDDETLVVRFDKQIDPDDGLRRLNSAMPDGIRLIDARRLQAREKMHPDTVRYRFDVGTPWDDAKDALMHKMMAAESLVVERKTPKSDVARSVDIRPYILDLQALGDTVEFTLRVTTGGTAKPAEIAGLLGYDPASVNHLIRRIEVGWQA